MVDSRCQTHYSRFSELKLKIWPSSIHSQLSLSHSLDLLLLPEWLDLQNNSGLPLSRLMKGPSTPKSVNKQKFDDMSDDSTARKCKFIPHWHDLFPWVKYKSDDGIMFCITCRKYQFWIELLKTHSTSTHHHLCSSQN